MSKLINDAKLLIQTTKVQPVECSTILAKMGAKHTNTNSASVTPSSASPAEGWTLPLTQCPGRSPAFRGSVFSAQIPHLPTPRTAAAPAKHAPWPIHMEDTGGKGCWQKLGERAAAGMNSDKENASCTGLKLLLHEIRITDPKYQI